jgi:hypothetical protein
MNESLSLNVLLANGVVQNCTLKLHRGPPWRLSIEGIALTSTEFTGDDSFDALCSLRKALENIGAKALCAGARIDVFPSGMSREMSSGRKAYIIRIGTSVSVANLVDIFDPTTPDLVGTVVEQKAYHLTWLSHFRK